MGIDLAVNRRLTKAFIDYLPVTLVLVPQVKVKKPAGGWVLEDGTPRTPQVMTLIEQTGLSGQPQPTRTVDGVERKVEFEVVAEWNAAISADDWFVYQGKEFRVIDLWIDNGWEKRALVVARG